MWQILAFFAVGMLITALLVEDHPKGCKTSQAQSMLFVAVLLTVAAMITHHFRLGFHGLV